MSAGIVGQVAGTAVALTLEEVFDFLKEHPDLIQDIRNVFASGTSKEALKQAIRSAQRIAAEEALEAEIGPRPTFYLAVEDDEALRRELRLTRRGDPNAETKVPCPWCKGDGMVHAEKRVEWQAAYPELSKKSGEVA